MTLAIVAPPKLRFLLDPVLHALEGSQTAFHRFQSVDEILTWPDIGDVTVLVTFECPARLLARTTNLKVVLNPVTGCDLIDLEAAAARDIPVGIGQVAENYEGMAEGTFLMILATLYDLPRLQEAVRSDRGRPPVTARMLRGKTIGLIGYGRIGRSLAKRLTGWDVDLVIASRTIPDDLPPNSRFVEIDELVGTSDVIVVLCALNEETRDLLNERRIGMMREGAFLINTARGGIVDEAALHAAVKKGAIAGIGLDVFRHEPLPHDSILRELPNAILTPHMIGHTVESEDALRDHLLSEIRSAMAGRPPEIIGNLSALQRYGREATA